jgi:hypothetical protein
MSFRERITKLFAIANRGGIRMVLVHVNGHCAGKLDCYCARLPTGGATGLMHKKKADRYVKNGEMLHAEGIHYFLTEKGGRLDRRRGNCSEIARAFSGGNFRSAS